MPPSASTLVSIITPSFNQGKYIEETIRSVLEQQYPAIEYIVMDGGSSDQTVDLLKKYDHGITRWVSQPDDGQADAINNGFRMASGEILAWLNADDAYLPGAIQKVVEYFRDHPEVDLVYGRAYNVDHRGNVIEAYGTEPFSAERLRERCFICQPSVFFRSKVFAEIGPLDTSLHLAFDYDYWLRAIRKFRFGYLPEFLSNNRWQMNSKSLSRPAAARREVLSILKKHFGAAPLSWIYNYSSVFTTQTLMPDIRGVYPDGWCGLRLSVFIRDAHATAISLSGEIPAGGNDTTLDMAIDSDKVDCIQLNPGTFSIIKPITRHSPASAVEVTFTSDSGVSPNLASTTTLLSRRVTEKRVFRLNTLALIHRDGKKRILYSRPRAWLALLLLPAVCLWTCIRVNHSIPTGELMRSGWTLWRYLLRSLFSYSTPNPKSS
jgi:GT2 family glycosyltransferase